MANQLAQTKTVAFIEVFNRCNCEDLEGPFGFFPDSVRPSNWIESSSGFAVKTLKKSFHFKETFLSSVYQKRVEYQNLLSMDSKNFKHTWLRALFRQLITGVTTSLHDVNADEDVSFVFKDFGLLKNISQKFNSNVSVFSGDDFDFDDKLHCFYHPKTGEIKGKNLVCLLNPEEAGCLKKGLFSVCFSKSYPRPYWCWQRLTFEFDDEGYPVPLYLVLADPAHIPWDHERLICLKKSLVFENRMELWVKIPYSSCDFSESVQKITKTLRSYFPKFKWICQSTDWATPAFLFPVYSKEALNHLRFKPTIHYGWSAKDLSPNGSLNREKNILKNLS